MLPLPAAGTAGGVPAARGDRGPFLEAGGLVPIALPCADYIMAGIAEALNYVEKLISP